MHSLKNTVVAVGLLGLSFLFYQASSNNPAEQSELIPALEISDGIDGVKDLASSGIDKLQSKMDSIKAMPARDLDHLSQNASELATSASQNIKDQAAQLKSHASDFARNALPSDIKIESSPAKPPTSFQATFPPNASTGQALQSAPPATRTTPAATPTDNRAMDSAARDSELIELLKYQNQNSAPQPPSDNRFAAEAKTGVGGEFQFDSQQIPSGDTSFNGLATDRSNDSQSNVMQANTEPDSANLNFQSAWPHVDRLVAEEKFHDALRLLSRYYNSPELTGPQRQRLMGWLDALAGKVIFSDEHHLENLPYTAANESLVDIGKRWKVPAQLIYNINRAQIPNPTSIESGTELKVVQGPFNAEIDLNQKIMTLFLGDLYAGRYPIRIGISGTPKPGSYRVLVKSAVGHVWRDAEGKDYPPNTPGNGYGPNWIGLSGSLCLHSVDDSVQDGHRGCLGLSASDSTDVFAILTEGSSVKIVQ